MKAALPFALCIPSFASSARQYRGLEKRLVGRFQVVAADLYGHGERAARWSATALRSIDVPCLLLTGTRSTAAARHAVALLRGLMRNVQVLALDGLGHMGPVSHAERVDSAIDAFLSASTGKHPYLVGTHPAPTLTGS